MPFDLPLDYLLGMTGWLLALAAGLVAMLWLRRYWSVRRKKRVKWANAALSVWMLLAGLTTVELYFAIVYDQSDAFNMTRVSQHWFARHVAPMQKVLRFSDGLITQYRDARPFPKKLEEGQHHICFIGDSFTFGHGVPNVADRFSDRIGSSLERKRPGRFVVSNLADAGKELKWVEMLLQEIVDDKLPVQTVVYVICLNDIETFDERTANVGQDLTITSRREDSFLVRHTYFFNLLATRFRSSQSAQVGGYYDNLIDSYESIAWERMRTKIDAIHLLCSENGIDLRIAIFPFLHDLGPNYAYAEAHRKIAEHCRKTGIPVVDLRPALEPHVKEGLTVNPLDTHPNERAHELAAEAIERDLLGDLLDK